MPNPEATDQLERLAVKLARDLSHELLHEVEQTGYDIPTRRIGQMLYRSLNKFAANIERASKDTSHGR